MLPLTANNHYWSDGEPSRNSPEYGAEAPAPRKEPALSAFYAHSHQDPTDLILGKELIDRTKATTLNKLLEVSNSLSH